MSIEFFVEEGSGSQRLIFVVTTCILAETSLDEGLFKSLLSHGKNIKTLLPKDIGGPFGDCKIDCCFSI